MKKNILILASLLVISIVSFASIINTSRSNIKRGVNVTYTKDTGITLTFDITKMDAVDKKALASGKFILEVDLVLDDKTCKEIGAPLRTAIKKGKWDITKVKGLDTCKPKFVTIGISEPGDK